MGNYVGEEFGADAGGLGFWVYVDATDVWWTLERSVASARLKLCPHSSLVSIMTSVSPGVTEQIIGENKRERTLLYSHTCGFPCNVSIYVVHMGNIILSTIAPLLPAN